MNNNNNKASISGALSISRLLVKLEQSFSANCLKKEHNTDLALCYFDRIRIYLRLISFWLTIPCTPDA